MTRDELMEIAAKYEHELINPPYDDSDEPVGVWIRSDEPIAELDGVSRGDHVVEDGKHVYHMYW